MPTLLDGRVALITGGSRGLGLAIAERFAAEGAVGHVLDLPQASAGAALPAGFSALDTDVGEEATIEAAIQAALRRHGRIDVVVANAGLVPPWRESEGLDMTEWDRVMAVNVRGVAATIKHATPAMKEKGGAIVVMASINAFLAHPRQMLYTASKHAALGIIRAAAQDLGRYRIRVNGIAPGPIATDALLQRIRARAAAGGPSEPEALARLGADNALARLATADEVAKAALFLASDLASGITGELLPVDAGLA
ncbi:SDR family NAD(P)-dependent oxidoreductase [Labrys monachus]|uniref:NAD(P)-dependent dehydrogenase (Short-subunit alcohol dehydrogenase family) n=1 Tax=Labrys monachus TaxID=217067 RepID=A0ABU0F7C7_9HYPH|nr:SDR family oxidoreductase [Labrys monachus]MDQ0390514.1 NAD(P)-dependent dehydrogenase (short-subunit alcohol dehydrogenase family) [Labrys monachus]